MNYQKELDYLSSIDQKRVLRTTETREGKHITINGKQLVDFSSNDYLGIAGISALRERFMSEVDIARYPFSSSASRLMSGNNIVVEELENLLATMYKGSKEALVFGGGFQANVGVIPALIDKNSVIFADKQVHASIIDGILLSGAKFYRYKHNDMDSLRELLEKHRAGYKDAWLITESIFSMDGDTADLVTIMEYKDKYNLSVFVDEAHAFGVKGENGGGVCVELGIDDKVDVIIGTFGKALASVGAFVACDKVIKEYLINKCRSFIFSTALPPINVLWTKWLLQSSKDILLEKRAKLQKLSCLFRERIAEFGLNVLGNSHIVPMVIGDNIKALELSRNLEEKGYLVFAVRPPTVPKGSARLRFSINAAIEEEDIIRIVDILSGERIEA